MLKTKLLKETSLLLAVFIVLLAIVLNWSSGQILAATEKCEPGPWTCSHHYSDPYRCDEFDVYRCANNFCGNEGGAMEYGQKFFMCVTHSWSCSNECHSTDHSTTYHVSGPHDPDSVEPYGEVPEYHICPTQYNNWDRNIPITECRGICYPAPEVKSLDDPSLLPKNELDESGYKLPVNFEWEDLEEEVSKPENYCTLGSYEFNIATSTLTSLSKLLTETKIQAITDSEYKLKCQLERDTEHYWKVRGCLDSEGKDCGDWSDLQSMKTSSAPELYNPYDQDWAESGDANADFSNLTLDWCETSFKSENSEEEAQVPLSLLLKFYIVENSEDKCHPDFESCDPFIVSVAPRGGRPPEQSYSDVNYNYFTKGYTYAWEVATCKDAAYSDCTEYSQRWRFTVGDFVIEPPGPTYPPDDPSGETPVGLPVTLQWSIPSGAESYIYSLDGAEGKTKNSSVTFNYPTLSLNKTYSWKVKPCWDPEGETCESWSETNYFKTTGQAPSLTYPSGSDIPMPVEFQWTKVSGAKSYIFILQGGDLDEQITTEENSISFDYPELKQETAYTWKVKTCAQTGGKLCGNYSPSADFTTIKLPAPNILSPENNDKIYAGQTNYLDWESVAGANFYQYEISLIQLAAEETSESCTVGNTLSGNTTSFQLSTPISLKCLGDYEWKMRSCFDEECTETGDWTSSVSFSFVDENAEPPSYGLVPCGKIGNNPNTTWDERDSCEVKHIFLLIRNIIDFMLWEFAPLMLGVLVLGTGLMFYFSIRFQDPIFLVRVKAVWRYAGIGYGIMFLSWTALNIFLRIIGFQIGIFGNWWQIGF
jgi:hypothetical protein